MKGWTLAVKKGKTTQFYNDKEVQFNSEAPTRVFNSRMGAYSLRRRLADSGLEKLAAMTLVPFEEAEQVNGTCLNDIDRIAKLECLQQAVQNKVSRVMDIAREKYGEKLEGFRRPKVRFSDKQKVVAGTATYARHQVKFSNDLLLRFGMNFIDEVVPHEVAHLVSDKVHEQRTHHSKLWKEVCLKLGGTGRKCHTMAVKRNKAKVYHYECGCQRKSVLEEVHRECEKGDRVMTCPFCEQEFEYTSTATLTVKPIKE